MIIALFFSKVLSHLHRMGNGRGFPGGRGLPGYVYNRPWKPGRAHGAHLPGVKPEVIIRSALSPGFSPPHRIRTASRPPEAQLYNAEGRDDFRGTCRWDTRVMFAVASALRSRCFHVPARSLLSSSHLPRSSDFFLSVHPTSPLHCAPSALIVC